MFLDGIKIIGYRSFNDEVVFDNLSKINLIIGQNNSGKSNLLRFLSRHLKNFLSKGIPFNNIDDRPRHSPKDLEVAFKISSTSACAENLIKQYSGGEKHIEALFSSVDHLWYYFTPTGDKVEVNEKNIVKSLGEISDQEKHNWEITW